jgi:hypothetical protein
MSSQTTFSILENLPGELLNQITDNLDFEAALHLSQTNRYFYSIIELSNRPASTNTLAKFEDGKPELDGPRLANHFACRMCRCIKPSKTKAWKWTVEFVEESWNWEWCGWRWQRTVEKRNFRACAKCLPMAATEDRYRDIQEALLKDIARFGQ